MILISDIHSRLFWKDVIPFFKLHPEECIVFMGDYVDPYLQDHVPENEIVERAADIFQFAANNKNNIILLQGNHDEVYLRNGIGAKCRFCHSQANQLFELYGEYKDLFKRYHVAFDTLFTHAGVTKNWLTQYKMKSSIKILFTGKINRTDNGSTKVHIRFGRRQCGTVHDSIICPYSPRADQLPS